MSVTKQTLTYTTQRVIVSSPKPIKAVIVALSNELNVEKAGFNLMQQLAAARTRGELEKAINGMTEGKRDFLYVLSILIRLLLVSLYCIAKPG